MSTTVTDDAAAGSVRSAEVSAVFDPLWRTVADGDAALYVLSTAGDVAEVDLGNAKGKVFLFADEKGAGPASLGGAPASRGLVLMNVLIASDETLHPAVVDWLVSIVRDGFSVGVVLTSPDRAEEWAAEFASFKVIEK